MVRRIFGWLVGWLVGGKTVKKERWQGHSRWRKKEFKYNFFLSFFFFVFFIFDYAVWHSESLLPDQGSNPGLQPASL